MKTKLFGAFSFFWMLSNARIWLSWKNNIIIIGIDLFAPAAGLLFEVMTRLMRLVSSQTHTEEKWELCLDPFPIVL